MPGARISELNVLITGAAGFIGSNFVRMLRKNRPQARIIAYDKLTYAGNLENLRDLEEEEAGKGEAASGTNSMSSYQFVRGDICDADALTPLFERGIDAVVNFAAESHVDRSILGAQEFVRTNVLGVQVLLDLAKRFGVKRFLQVSTDEVYGSLGPTGKFTEETPLSPNSPYSASKAGADLLVQAYHHTFGLPTLITRCSNNYGPYQFPEKLIPLFVTNLLAKRKVPVYGDGLNVRDWIHVQDHCEAILTVLEKAEPGALYNIGGNHELTNLEITRAILQHLGCGDEMIEYVKDRPGHDRRYAMDSSRIERELGWRPKVRFEEGLADTIQWYIDHRSWWERIKTGEYLRYYDMQYGVGGVVGKSA